MLVVLAIGAALSRPLLERGVPPAALVLADRSGSVAPGALERALAGAPAVGDAGRVGMGEEDGARGARAGTGARPYPFGGGAGGEGGRSGFGGGSESEGGRSGFGGAFGSGGGQLAFGDAGASPLGGALDAALRALPGGGRLLLLSDGLATDEVLAAAARARAAGLRVDAVLLETRAGPDAAVTLLEAPGAWRAGEAVPLAIGLWADRPVTATLAVAANGRVFETRAVALGPEVSRLELRYPAAGERDLRFEARLSLAGDREPGNDAGFAATHVAAPPSVLVVGDSAGAVGLADGLAAQGALVSVLGPDRVPGRLSALETFDALFLVDVPARALGLDQLAAIEAFAAELGRGVVLTGGRRSFLPGGWENTPLADMAPLALDPPPREEREPVALLLMLDQSASMGSVEGRGTVSKLDLAREAAILAAEVLHPGDRIGLLTYDDAARWLLPLAELGPERSLAEVEQAVGGLATGGGTRIGAALALGLPALAALGEVPTRHAVLLSDGRDPEPDLAAYEAQVAAARAAGATLSTIAIGSDVDRLLLARLARLGRGRYHSAAEPADLPRLALAESEIVRARVEQEGEFHALPAASGDPLAASLDLADLPALTGYLAMRPRPGAEVLLEAPTGDPLLAAWNFGLGRVLAWSSDAGEDWTAAWPASPAGRAFWRQLLRHAARAPDAGPPGLEITWRDGLARVELDALDRAGRPIDLAQASLTLTGTQASRTVPLLQTAPGRYAADVALPGPGAYPGFLRLESESGSWTLPAPLAWRAPAELLPQRPVLAAAAESGPPTRIPLWPWLLALAAGLWVLDVARQTRAL